mgnify:CR=1 FL=1
MTFNIGDRGIALSMNSTQAKVIAGKILTIKHKDLSMIWFEEVTGYLWSDNFCTIDYFLTRRIYV